MRSKRRKKTLQQTIADRFDKPKKRRITGIVSASQTTHRHRKANPFKPQTDKSNIISQKIMILLGALSAVGTLGMLLYHPFFHIHTVNISGIERLSHTEVEEAISGIMDYRRYLILPGKSYVAVNVVELRDILVERFPIDAIEVKKKFPNTLEIKIDEKLSTIILGDRERYQFVDLQGHVVEDLRLVMEDEWERKIKITTTTLADGTIRTEETVISEIFIPKVSDLKIKYENYPIVHHTNRGDGTVLLPPVHIQNIISWYTLLESTNNPSDYFKLGSNDYHASIFTKKGITYHINIEKNPQEQFETLLHVLNNEIKSSAVSYIDIRFPTRVYWK